MTRGTHAARRLVKKTKKKKKGPGSSLEHRGPALLLRRVVLSCVDQGMERKGRDGHKDGVIQGGWVGWATRMTCPLLASPVILCCGKIYRDPRRERSRGDPSCMWCLV